MLNARRECRVIARIFMLSSGLPEGEAYLGFLSFAAFIFSVIAAVLAIDMYTLLRTGEFGNTWRVLIIASVIYALLQALRMAESLNWRIASHGLSQIVELTFALALAYAFYLQRKTFTQAAALRHSDERRSEARARTRSGEIDKNAVPPNQETPPTETDNAPSEIEKAVSALHETDDTDIEWEPRD